MRSAWKGTWPEAEPSASTGRTNLEPYRAGQDPLQRSENLLGVPFRLHLLKHLGNLAVRTYYKRGPGHTHVLFPVHGFLLPHSVSLRDFVILVREQRERQFVLALEFGLRSGCIG